MAKQSKKIPRGQGLQQRMLYVGPLSPPRVGDAGWDLPAKDAVIILPGRQVQIPTGVFLGIPEGFVALLKERSSLSVMRCYAHAGVIDSSYRGEIVVVLGNYGNMPVRIEKGQRIAQAIVVPHLTAEQGVKLVDIEELPKTKRGAKGFGSTGK